MKESNTPQPLNTVNLKDDKREFTIYYDSGSNFVVHTKNLVELEETLTEYSFESFVMMQRLMDVMVRELCLTNTEARKKLFNINKPEVTKSKV